MKIDQPIMPVGLKPNLNKLKKAEILWLYNHRCQEHSRRYIEHPACYVTDVLCDPKVDSDADELKVKRVGFLDIEATELYDAHFGFTLCYCIKELNGPTITNYVTQEEIRSYQFDRRLIEDCIRDIRKFDHIITWNGGRSKWGYDIPFLITRALKWGLAWPGYKEVSQDDLLVVARTILKLRRRSLGKVCDLLGIPSKEHRLDPDTWQMCMAGCDKKMLEIVVPHCQEDVASLEGVWQRIINILPGPSTRSL